jgi:hypothetical protein
MAFTDIEIAGHAAVIERVFWSKRRPALRLRDRMREGQRFAGQSIELFFVRPLFSDPSRIVEESIAKLTFLRVSGRWRIFWKRADLKWHRYAPHPEAASLAEALSVVDRDTNGCFFG